MAESLAQAIVDRASDLRRAIETTPQPDRVLAGIVAFDDLATIFRTFHASQQSFSRRVASRPSQIPAILASPGEERRRAPFVRL
jgi:hypothetical protein